MTDPNAVGIEGAINGAISTIEGDITTSPNNIAINIYFTGTNTGLGGSENQHLHRFVFRLLQRL